MKNYFMKHKILTGILVIFILGIIGNIGGQDVTPSPANNISTVESITITESVNEELKIEPEKVEQQVAKSVISTEEPVIKPVITIKPTLQPIIPTDKPNIYEGYTLIEVDGGNLSGYREPNVVVDIGFGDREYLAFTNEYGQLIRVIAKEIRLQDPAIEPVLSNGRYYKDEAKVPGVESSALDEGHVIADSLGGVANAYNITPQNSTLNRHGDQAYMEKVIRDAGGCINFEAIITYPDTTTQIPNKYKYTYSINGNTIVDEFENVNPDEVNQQLDSTNNIPTNVQTSQENDISKIDTNSNGIVTISEAKAAGFIMPITRDHWLYKYMRDSDGDGIVGE